MNRYKKALIVGLPLLMGAKIYFSGGKGLFVPLVNNNQSGRVILITGGSEGIGLETVKYLAQNGASNIIMASRNEEKALAAIKQLKEELLKKSLEVRQIEFMKLDLNDLRSVSDFISAFKSKYNKIDTLINNAGLFRGQGTSVGYEKIFLTNHIGPFFLTTSLLPLINNNIESRIINVSSVAHERAPSNFSFNDSPEAQQYFKKLDPKSQINTEGFNYQVSKLANILFTQSLKKYLETQGSKIQVYSLHPGVVRTALFDELLKSPVAKMIFTLTFPFIWLTTKSSYQGALTSINLATLPTKQLMNGGYYRNCLLYHSSDASNDVTSQVALWNKTVTLLENEGYQQAVRLF